MKILLSQRLECFPALTGAAKSSLHLLRLLADRGHACRLVALASADQSPEVHEWCGVEVRTFPDSFRLWTHLADQIHQFDPDLVAIGEDPTGFGLATALEETGRARVVCFAHSQATLPFGPESFLPDSAKTDLLARAAAILTPSRYVTSYIHRWSGLMAHTVELPVYGCGPFPDVSSFERGYVTLINPSEVKGLCIFEELARARPQIEFAAVPTWATTTGDRGRLEAFANVHILPPSEDIDAIFRQTRLLLVPSLWGEAFGRIVVEAMLRGIPVLAADVGGLPEAKLGVDYLLPVRPIQRYVDRRDDRGLPIPIVPPQDIAPWVNALDELLSDREHYRRLSSRSRTAAHSYVASLSITPCEELLRGLTLAQSSSPSAGRTSASVALSPNRLELLDLLVRDCTLRSHDRE